MIRIDVPGRGEIALEHLVLDFNGTIAHDGRLIDGVAEAIGLLSDYVSPIIVTADMHGTAAQLGGDLGIEVHVIEPGDERAAKAAYVAELGPASVAALGNGANDVEMVRVAGVGIAVIGAEGAAADLLSAADVVVTDVAAALGLLVVPQRLAATLRR